MKPEDRIAELKAKGKHTSPAEKKELKELKDQLKAEKELKAKNGKEEKPVDAPAESSAEDAEKRAVDAEARVKELEAQLEEEKRAAQAAIEAAKADGEPIAITDKEKKDLKTDANAKVDKLNEEQKIVPNRYEQKCVFLYPGNKKCGRPFGDVKYSGNFMQGCPTNDVKHHIANGTLPESALPQTVND